MHFVMHLVRFSDRPKGRRKVVRGNLESLRCKLHPHEKIVRVFVCVMVGVENVAAEIVNESRYSSDDASTVFAMNQQDDGIFALRGHRFSLHELASVSVAERVEIRTNGLDS